MNLTSVAAVRGYSGLAASDISDYELGNLVTLASAVIRGYCSRDITAEGPYTETFDGNGGAKFVPQQWPVTAVSSVTVNDQAIPAATSATAPGFVFSAGAVGLRGYRFSCGMANCTVAYTAGQGIVPADVEQACILTVLAAYNAATRDPAVRSEVVNHGVYQATYAPLEIPADAKLILDQTPYVRRWA